MEEVESCDVEGMKKLVCNAGTYIYFVGKGLCAKRESPH